MFNLWIYNDIYIYTYTIYHIDNVMTYIVIYTFHIYIYIYIYVYPITICFPFRIHHFRSLQGSGLGTLDAVGQVEIRYVRVT